MNEAKKLADELLTQTNEASAVVGNHLTAVKALRVQVAEAEGADREILTAELAAAEEAFNTELARFKSIKKQAGDAAKAAVKLTPEDTAELNGYYIKYTGKPMHS